MGGTPPAQAHSATPRRRTAPRRDRIRRRLRGPVRALARSARADRTALRRRRSSPRRAPLGPPTVAQKLVTPVGRHARPGSQHASQRDPKAPADTQRPSRPQVSPTPHRRWSPQFAPSSTEATQRGPALASQRRPGPQGASPTRQRPPTSPSRAHRRVSRVHEAPSTQVSPGASHRSPTEWSARRQRDPTTPSDDSPNAVSTFVTTSRTGSRARPDLALPRRPLSPQGGRACSPESGVSPRHAAASPRGTGCLRGRRSSPRRHAPRPPRRRSSRSRRCRPGRPRRSG